MHAPAPAPTDNSHISNLEISRIANKTNIHLVVEHETAKTVLTQQEKFKTDQKCAEHMFCYLMKEIFLCVEKKLQ